ncbi:MAG: hypothetical protein JWP87_6083 [Labilithrix sp.]|nr:hypothetical protein [Labilithrix sp.]
MLDEPRALRLKRLQWLAAITAGVVQACVVVACSSSDKPAVTGGTTTLPDGSEVDARAGGDGGVDGGGDGGIVMSTEPIGDLPTVDEADVPCVKPGGTRTVLFPAGSGGSGGPAVRTAQLLGARRFGAGPNIEGFVTFDATGSAPQLFPVTLGTKQTSFSSEGTTIGALVLDDATVEYQRYDAMGVASGARVTLATNLAPAPDQGFITSGGGGSLAVWTTGDKLSAAGITTAGASAGAAWTLETAATSAKVALTYAGGKYAIAYSFLGADQKKVARFQLADATGASGAAITLTSGTGTIDVVAITATPNGFLLVFDGGGDDKVYAVPLDATGKVAGVARRLLGGDSPWAVASLGNQVALVTMSNDTKVSGNEGPRKPQFRALDATGKPLAPWVCLDDRVPAGQYQDMGVVAESNGFAVVFKSVADETVLQRFDNLGTGNP